MKPFSEKQCLTFLKSTFLNAGSRCIQPGYYEKVQDVIDALRKAGLDNLTEVVLSYDMILLKGSL